MDILSYRITKMNIFFLYLNDSILGGYLKYKQVSEYTFLRGNEGKNCNIQKRIC